jgi:protein dithiol oxidoreductase (disulfide-forming)
MLGEPPMKRYLVLPLLAVLLLPACDTKKEGAAETPAADTASATSDAELMAAAEAAAKASTDPNAAAVTDPAASADPNAAPTGETPPPAEAIPGLVKGKDYDEIPGGQPFDPANGKIEVVEVFNFVCPACAGFQPMIVTWKNRLPADVRFTYVPAAFGGNWDQFVRSYYTAETMGIAEKAHEATYDAIHFRKTLKGERGEDSDEDLGKFYSQFGVDAKQFASSMRSFAVTAKFNKAKKFIIDSRVNSTPTLVVNGKYRILGRTTEDVLGTADLLIAHERAQAKAGAAPANAQ